MLNANNLHVQIKESGLEVSELPRHIVWRAGHENSEGKITDEKVQTVVGACVNIIFKCNFNL